MSRSRYPSDLTDQQWAVLEYELLREHDGPGRPIEADRQREYLDAILYVLRTGCPWRHLPHDFAVAWSSAHQQFLRWTRRGVWDRVLICLREAARLSAGRDAKPTGAVVDSSSVKAGPVTGPRGFDGARKIDGIKRHILTDTTGLLLAVEVTAADTQDRTVLPRLLKAAAASCPAIGKVWADKGYTGPATRELAEKTGIDIEIEIVSGPKPPPGTGFLVQPRVGSSNTPTPESTAAADSSGSGKPPSKPTPDSSSSARSHCYSNDDRHRNLSTRFSLNPPLILVG